MKLTERLKYINISTRISVLVAIIIIFTMGFFAIISLNKQERDYTEITVNNSNQLCQTIEKILRFSMLDNRRDEIAKALNEIAGKNDIRTVRILNRNGLIKFSTLKSEVNSHISADGQICSNCHYQNQNNSRDKYRIKKNEHVFNDEENKVVFNCVPIYNAPGCSGKVCHLTNEKSLTEASINHTNNFQIYQAHDSTETILGLIQTEISTEKALSNLQQTRLQLILITILIALLASVVSYFSIKSLLGNPVKELVKGTRRVAEGNLREAIPPGKAELGELSNAFNLMQKQILATQAQLIESEKLASIGKLADEIAYQINNPLTGIIIYIENLIENLNSENKNYEDYQVIRREALRIREIIRNILFYTRRGKPVFKPVNIKELISHSVSVVEKFANFQNIKLIKNISAAVPEISADAGLLEQVFLNLLIISSESIPKGGIITISISSPSAANEIEINFSNTNQVIPENIIAKIFKQESFRSLDNFEGTAISLAVCKNIVELHNGNFSVSSESGTGTTFRIKLLVR